jgi:hypothetical protein
MQIGAAHAARQHLKLNLAIFRLRHRDFAQGKRFPGLIENHRTHLFSPIR